MIRRKKSRCVFLRKEDIVLGRVSASKNTENKKAIDLLFKKAAEAKDNIATDGDLRDIDEFRKKINSFTEIADKMGYNLILSLEPKNTRSAFFSRLATALIKDYFCIVSVDVKSGRFAVYSADDRYGKMNPETSGEDFFSYIKDKIAVYVYEEDRDKFIYYFDKSRLLKELTKTETVSFLVRFNIKDEPVSMQVKITKAEDYHLTIGVSDVDAQVKRRIEYEKAQEQRITYSRIAQILARDYFSIYYIDIKTERFIEYSSQQKYKRLKIEQTGDNFFTACQKNIQRVIHESDRARISNALQKDFFLSQLENGRSFSVSYRLNIGGEVVYATLKALRISDEDGDHILIGVKNMNAQIKREQSLKKAIDKAQALAVKDALTNVKNKHAYSEAEKFLNERIAKKESLEFAVVICDINDLKLINDMYGHKVGDESIKTACSIVCEVFKCSPVYRVGGDEFAVILQGADYDNRYELVDLLRAKMRKNRRNGNVIMACGISEYTEGDLNVSAVFERADENMYADKHELKNGNK